MEFNMSDYLSSFVDEFEEQLQILDVEILRLEKDPMDMETIQNIFRAAHTLKGSSAAMGFDRLKEVTHHLENVFDQIRTQQLNVSIKLITVIFETIDFIRLLKDAVIDHTINTIDITKVVEQLNRLIEDCDHETEIKKENASITSTANIKDNYTLDEYQINVLNKGIKFGYTGWEVNVELCKEAQMKNVRALLVEKKLRTMGEIIVSIPTTDIIEQDEQFTGKMCFIFLSHYEKEEIEKELNEISDIAYSNINLMAPQSVDSKYIQDTTSTLQPNTKQMLKTENTSEIMDPKSKMLSRQKLTSTVRVDVEKLEHLMNLVGELIIDQTRLVDVRSKFSEIELASSHEFEVLDEVTNHLSRVITELQGGMMKTRMLPIEQLFNRFPRMVRDTSLKANKSVDFIIEGEETELDRTLIEEIIDPIIHLLRNAVDHGIESSEQRLSAGKSANGTIKLVASHEENHVVIKVIDDGKGINPEKIKRTAVEKHIITEEEANKLNDKDALLLIFNSGFSTAETVTEISGRGVGMDIVKSHIEKLNGIIDIDSVIGVGTTFTIKLPLTLAIIPSLLVKFGDKTFAIPLVNVLEIIRVNTDDIQIINSQEYGMIRGRVLPLIRMKKLLGIEEEEQNEVIKNREFVVIVGIAEKRIGIIADKTIGNQEIVIKSLGSYIGSPPFISGGTIMGDGSVALILDVSSVIQNYGTQVHEQITSSNKEYSLEERQIVTFNLDNDEYGIEIKHAKDIIAVPHITNIIQSSDDVLGIINLRGNILPVINLRSRFGLANQAQTLKSRVIVIENGDKDVAILVDEVTQVLNIKEDTIEQLNQTHLYAASKWINGISKLEGRVILLLNINEVLLGIEQLGTTIEHLGKSSEEDIDHDF